MYPLSLGVWHFTLGDEIKGLDLGNLNPIYERVLNKQICTKGRERHCFFGINDLLCSRRAGFPVTVLQNALKTDG